MSGRAGELLRRLGGMKGAALIAAVGLALLLWPSGTSAEAPEPGREQRLAAVLSRIEGVGQTEVLLSDSGAVVVCRGAENASARLAVAGAVRCYTGLGANEIVICKLDE